MQGDDPGRHGSARSQQIAQGRRPGVARLRAQLLARNDCRVDGRLVSSVRLPPAQFTLNDHPGPMSLLPLHAGHQSGQKQRRWFQIIVTYFVLTAGVNLTVVAGENLTVGSTVWLPAESLAPGR